MLLTKVIVLHVFQVVQSDKVNLLGRDVGNKMEMGIVIPCGNENDGTCDMNSTMLCTCNMNATLPCSEKSDIPSCNNNIHAVKQEIKDFHEYLNDNYESCVNQSVHLNVATEAKPKFPKARTVLLRLRDQV